MTTSTGSVSCTRTSTVPTWNLRVSRDCEPVEYRPTELREATHLAAGKAVEDETLHQLHVCRRGRTDRGEPCFGEIDECAAEVVGALPALHQAAQCHP
jgi:hypothetical protein